MANYYTPFSLRVPEEVMLKVKRIAEKNHRSANREIEFALERYIEVFEQEHGEIMIKPEES